MIRAVVDTHTLIWYVFNDPPISATANAFIDSAEAAGEQIGFSPVSIVEIIYLIEKGRVHPLTLNRVMNAVSIFSFLHEVALDHAIALTMQQISRADVPDMPDRMIAATALHLGVPLISRDRRIVTSAVPTVW